MFREFMSEVRVFAQRNMDDEKYIQKRAKHILGYELDLNAPQTFNDKLNWLKLHDRKPIYTQMVDKIEAKNYVSERIGDSHVVPLLGVWDRYEDIDFDFLPNQFVLKCNHGSKNFVCTDKKHFPYDEVKKEFDHQLKKNIYYNLREWPYKNVKRRILAEEYIPTLGKDTSVEYKLTTYNGKVKLITICTGPAHVEDERRYNDHFDRYWNRIDFYATYKNTNKDIPKPDFMDEMIELSERLAEDVPTVRVDWYYDSGKILFGELTFYTWGGFISFVPEKMDAIMGSWLDISRKVDEEKI